MFNKSLKRENGCSPKPVVPVLSIEPLSESVNRKMVKSVGVKKK